MLRTGIFSSKYSCNMAALSMCRSALRRNVVPLSLGLSAGAMMISRQTPLRFDSRPAARSMSSGRKDRLDPEVIKQLSGGSLSGTTCSTSPSSGRRLIPIRLPFRVGCERLLQDACPSRRLRHYRHSGTLSPMVFGTSLKD